MEQTDREDRIRRAIITYSALGIFVIGVIVAAVAITPLYSRLKVNAENSLSHAVRISTIAVDEIVLRAKDLALQVTSRTQIRKRLEAYNRGEIGHEELVAFSRDKLGEAMRLAAEIRGITRLGPDGTPLIETGIAAPLQTDFVLPADDTLTPEVHGPVTINDNAYLLVAAPIFGPQSQRVGTDVIVFSIASLQAVVNDYTGLGETGQRVLAQISDDGATLLFPQRGQGGRTDLVLPADSPIAAGLARSAAGHSGIDHALDATERRFIVAYAPLQSTEWGLVVSMESRELYLAANQLILLIIAAIGGLVLAGSFGIVWLIRPLSNTLHRELVRRKRAEQALRRHQDDLEELVRGRTNALCAAYKEMESFSYSVSHDLRAPLRAIGGFSEVLQEEHGTRLDEDAKDYLARIRKSVAHMNELIDSLLQLSRLSRWSLRPRHIDMHELVYEVIEQLRNEHPLQKLDVRIDEVPAAMADARLVRVMIENLISNAWKYSAHRQQPLIHFGCRENEDGVVYFVSDNGVGFDMASADKLFGVFQRLHPADEFEGTGIGLATVKRIIDRHGGRIWAEAKSGEGATFFFRLPESPAMLQDDEWRSACA